jgi:hypothetical protein
LNGNNFQLAVQSHFLNNKFSLTIDKNFIISDYEIKYCYDCASCIPDFARALEKSRSKIFHFLQTNHFAFDSMLYDPVTKTLILFQITINSNHDIHYDEIISFIKKEPIQIKLEQLKTKMSQKYEKYFTFFREIIENKYVENFVFQWLTPQIFDNIVKTAKNVNAIHKCEKLIVYGYHQLLVDEILFWRNTGILNNFNFEQIENKK